MKENRLVKHVSLLVLCCGVLSADPIPVSLVGLPPNWIQVQTSGANYHPTGNGGGFAGTVWTGTTNNAGGTPIGGAGQQYATTMWCVDSQMFFSNGNQGLANLNLLTTLPTSQARYGTVDDATNGDGDPGWTNDFGSSILNSSVARFKMAAWLVQQYSGFPAGPSVNGPPNTNIQKAIWTIIHNSTPGADGPGFSSIGSDNTSGGVLYWVNAAKANYSSIDPNKWAIVTWLVDVGGILNVDLDNQTFLVQVVPEPGFYGLLAIGFCGLFVVARRRERRTDPAGMTVTESRSR
jgi:hypothetical protein